MKEKFYGQPTQQEVAGLKPDSNPSQNVDIPTVLRDSRGRVRWSLPGNTPEENEQIGIQNVQGLFLEAYPDFLERFSFGEDGSIPENRREEAKEFILDKIGDKEKFSSQIGKTLGNRKQVPYFDGSHFTAIRKSFTTWGIDFEEFNIDSLPNDDRWVNANYVQKKFGITPTAIGLDGLPSKKDPRKRGHSKVLYDKTALEQRAREMISGPRVDRETGRAEDKYGNVLISLKTLSNETGLDIGVLKNRLKNLTTLQGRGKNNRSVVLYYESEAREEIGKFLAFPQTNPETNMYIDENGIKWISLHELAKNLGCSVSFVYTTLKKSNKISYIQARGRQNKEVTLFDEISALEALSQAKYIQQIEQMAKDEHQPPPDGWMTNFAITKKFKASQQTTKTLAQSFTLDHPEWSRVCIDGRGRLSEYYSPELVEAISKVLNEKRQQTNLIPPDQANEQLMKYLEARDE